MTLKHQLQCSKDEYTPCNKVRDEDVNKKSKTKQQLRNLQPYSQAKPNPAAILQARMDQDKLKRNNNKTKILKQNKDTQTTITPRKTMKK